MLRVGVRQGQSAIKSRAFLCNRGFVRTFVCSGPVRATESNLKVVSSSPQATIENNIKSDTNRLSKTLTKFWEKVDTHYNAETEKYEVQLDGKTLKTPLGFPLALPKDKQVYAQLIEHEWSHLPDLKIKTNSLPLTSIAARSIDLETVHGPGNKLADLVAKVGRLDDIKFNLLRYLDTDTCLIFTTQEEYEGKLRQKQNELYMPLIKEYEHFFTQWGLQHKLLPNEHYQVKLQYLDCETDGLKGNQQSITTQNIVLHWLNHISIYDLVALEKAILTSKSFLCGVSLLRSNVAAAERQAQLYQINKPTVEEYYFKSIDELVELANLETIFQTNQWGEVEDTHDVDKVDWIRNLSSAALLCN